MNEQIRELAKQKAWHAGGGLVSDLAVEVIAELIVRECARIASNADLEDVEGGDSAVLRAASEQIKKHFGVE